MNDSAASADDQPARGASRRSKLRPLQTVAVPGYRVLRKQPAVRRTAANPRTGVRAASARSSQTVSGSGPSIPQRGHRAPSFPPIPPAAGFSRVTEPAEPPPPAADAWTVGRILEWTTQHLKKHGSDSPRLDAEILLAHAKKCARIQLYANFNEVLSEGVRAIMRDLVQRRARHEPVAYLTETKEFFSLPFRVTRDVLIPRPDTETLVVAIIEELKQKTGSPRLLDLCTGSGCIAIAAAKNLPALKVIATDLSPAALEIARGNAAKLGVAERMAFAQGDLFAALKAGEQFDVIASNPPYIPTADIATLDPDVRDHEPRSALDGGKDGLDLIRRLLDAAGDWLAPGGLMLIEFTPEQAAAIEELVQANPAWTDLRILRDLGHQARVVSVRKK